MADHETEAVLPDLHFVAVREVGVVDPVVVDVGAVQRTDVAEVKPVRVPVDRDVPA